MGRQEELEDLILRHIGSPYANKFTLAENIKEAIERICSRWLDADRNELVGAGQALHERLGG